MIRSLSLLMCLTACTTLPQVDGVSDQASLPAPRLLPTDDLLMQIGAPTAAQAGNTLDARAAALRNRAAGLRGL